MSKELEEAIEVLIDATFRFRHWMAEDLENVPTHRRITTSMAADMPQAYAAMKALLGAADAVKVEQFYLRRPELRPK